MKLPVLQPKRVFEIFEEIAAIPHGSGNTEAISQYCLAFAEKLGLDAQTDALHNVVIRKAASPGYEDHSPVLLQGHLDMVCESERPFDFEMEGLSLHVEGDFLRADGTTLGGDDGIAVAMILALLEDDSLARPPIEALFTTDEETGMYGAVGLDPAMITAKQLINIDSEDEGVFTVGCAGGARVEIDLPLVFEPIALPCYKITVSGLIGGHSGNEIDKERLNANRVMGRILSGIGPLQLIAFDGGGKDNAIPRSCVAVVAAQRDPNLRLPLVIGSVQSATDPDLTVTIEPTETYGRACDKMSTGIALSLLQALPNGIQQRCPDMPEMVQTSLNLGIAALRDGALHLSYLVRSSVNEEKARLLSRMERVAGEHGAVMTTHSHYPAWEYKKDSPLREKMIAAYRDLYDSDPQVVTIHAGLECGILGSKIPGMDAVSIGPDLFDIHTSRERLSISSTERVYRYLCHVLATL
ncbi:MAG: aminoacyl-histidine dipeptidase [Clostridia bacterium]|nr:aminoacyl-histidine dipeptidase [Clostridia bacterium]